MKKPFVYLLTTLTCLSSQNDAMARIRRVTPTGGSTTSGISWVDASAFGNLQTAISASAIGDTVWVKAGTYQPATGASFRMKEGVVILGGFNGTETVVTDRDWMVNATILNGNEATVVLNTFTAGSPMSSSAVLDGFTITNGKSYTYSGGIHNEYASPVINNCRLLKDTTWKTGQGYGGGIGNVNSSPVVSNTLLKQCYAEYSGGGMSNSYSSGVFSNLIIDSNAAVLYGGGICNWSTGTPVFESIIICNNAAIGSASGGAGMANIYADAEPTINNTVFINNRTAASTTYGGGGFWNYAGTASLANVTFVGNSADYGGALRVTTGAIINIVNAVFWNNTASVSGNDMNISGGSSINTTYSYTQSVAAGAGNILGTASPFVDIATPKGPDGIWMTEDDGLRPVYSSLIRDAGTGTGAPVTDILGKPRPGGAGYDMGAYESSLRLYVKADATGANNGSNWANAFTNLQQAIDSSKAGGEIWIAAGTYKPSKDAFGNISPADIRDKAFYIRDSVSLYGGFNGTENNIAGRAGLFAATILSGDLDNTPAVYTDDAYHVVLSISSSAATLLDGVTIEKGNAGEHTAITVSGYNISRGSGAGMYLANSPLTIRNVTFRDNRADFGGGIYNEESDAILDHVLFLRNIADTQAGGMFNRNAAPTVAATVFEANSSGGDGGAMSNNGNTVTMTLNNVIFRNNTAAGHAGAMDNNMNVIARNAVFSNNEAVAGHGGAIAQHSDKLTAVNNIFWGNAAGSSDADLYVDLTISSVTYSYAQAAISGTGNTTGAADPFLDNAYPKGPDSLWLTADDGLQLPFCSNLVNIGDNMGVSATDILGRPRISSTTVDLGAYEKQSYLPDFKKNARLSNNTANALPFIPICDEGEWTYYADPTMPDSLSFAIAWGAPNAAAKATAEMRLTVAPALTAATTTTDGIWTMRRYWNVNLGADTLSAPVKVRFYYNPADTIAMRAAANSWNTTYGIGLDAISPVRWFKTISVPFTPSLVTPTDINAGNKKLLKPVYGSSNGVAYVQFDTVTSFSGGTAAIGAKLGALALPLELISYTAQYADNRASVLSNWTVAEESAVRYDIQRSTDAQHFETVGRVTAAKNYTYTYTDLLPASVNGQQLYYRLAIVDADNSLSYSGVVRLSAGKASEAMLSIAPNPVSSSFTIINTDAGRNGQEAVITDLLGTVVSRITIAAELSVSTQSWLPGVYILRLADASVYRIAKQ